MTKSDKNPSIGTLAGGALAVLVGLWLLLKVFRTLLWFVKVGIILAVIAVIFYAVKSTIKKK